MFPELHRTAVVHADRFNDNPVVRGPRLSDDRRDTRPRKRHRFRAPLEVCTRPFATCRGEDRDDSLIVSRVDLETTVPINSRLYVRASRTDVSVQSTGGFHAFRLGIFSR